MMMPDEKKDNRYKIDARWAVFLFLFLILFCFSCSQKKQEQAIPVTVIVSKVNHVNDFQKIMVTGAIVSPDAPSNVSFLVSGRVVQVGPREGDYVKKGQLLASLDQVDYRLAVDASQAQSEQER
jgi:multidrug efflux pump subunit AcrA (membrane-fusion protein)